jgi:hypothetical protein
MEIELIESAGNALTSLMDRAGAEDTVRGECGSKHDPYTKTTVSFVRYSQLADWLDDYGLLESCKTFGCDFRRFYTVYTVRAVAHRPDHFTISEVDVG